MEWSKGSLLDNSVAVSMMAMIYFVFAAINTILFMAVTMIQNFLAILKRMSIVL